jgi:hypothetical protein
MDLPCCQNIERQSPHINTTCKSSGITNQSDCWSTEPERLPSDQEQAFGLTIKPVISRIQSRNSNHYNETLSSIYTDEGGKL